MNKSELVTEVTRVSGVSKFDVSKVVDAVLQAITDELSNNEDGKVQIVGFGTFQNKRRKATSGRNPQTGEEIAIPESVVPVFKAGKGLKEAVAKLVA